MRHGDLFGITKPQNPSFGAFSYRFMSSVAGSSGVGLWNPGQGETAAGGPLVPWSPVPQN